MEHYSVLLEESIDLLAIKPDGIYVDGTFGRGGHTRGILAKLSDNGRVFAFDKDPDAISYAKETIDDKRLTLIHDSFANMTTRLSEYSINMLDGVLFDLGVSSPQLDTAERGFSFRFESPLDMRMDNHKGQTAADWLNSAEETELADVFWRYGEEKFSRKIAKAIVNKRKDTPLVTTSDLAKLVEDQIPYRESGQHPATRVFQATRIWINNELLDLENSLDKVPYLLKKGGRMVVISFHSLEDRIVKTKFADLASTDKLPKWVMVTNESEAEFKVIAKKIKAGNNEVSENVRSRSAVMRSLERVNVKSV